MDLHRPQYFMQVVHDHSISVAAKHLNISQSALSVHIQSLENELGVPLFLRKKRKLILTPAGVTLAARAMELLNLDAKITTEVQSFTSESTSDIWIGGIESHAFSLVIKEITKYTKLYSDIHIHILSNNENVIYEQLSRNQIDLAVVRTIPNNSLEYESIEIPINDTWGVICLKEHPFAAKPVVTPQDLAHERIIINEEACRSVLQPWMREYMNQLKIVATGNLAHNCTHLISEGFGIMIQSKDWIQVDYSRIYTFVPFSPPLKTKLYLVWKRRIVSATINTIVRMIQNDWMNNQNE